MNLLPIAVSALMMVGAVLFGLKTWRTVRTARHASQFWRRTQGVVLHADSSPMGLGESKSKDPRKNSHLLDFKYEYTVDGRSYTSQKPLFFELYRYDEINDFLESYPAGRSVEVFYDPEHPQRAVLETRLRGKSGQHEFWMSALIFLAGLILLITQLPTQ